MSRRESVNLAVSGGTPGADSANYTLFDSTVAFGGGQMKKIGASRLIFYVENSQSGTLILKTSVNKGLNWDQTGGAGTSVSASAANDVSGPYDFPVDPFDDVQLIWTNGGSAQTTWRPSLTLVIGDRASTA